MTTLIENTSVDNELDINELTEASLTGKGVFDVLLQTLRLHLDREFKDGRITGTAYATVYSQALTTFLQQSVQFCLSKTKMALELKLLKEQVTVTQLQQAQLTAQTAQITYITATQLPAQTADINAGIALKTYELSDIKPSEKAHLIAQTSHVTKQQLNTEQQTANLVSQKAQVEAEIAKINYQTTYMLPEEVELVIRNQSQVTAQTAEVTYRTGYVLPSQLANTTAQTAQVVYNTDYVLPKQVLLAQAQIDNTEQQTTLYAQKTTTELAQTTTTPAAGSVMGVQNLLMTTQKESFLRDAEQKAAKMLIDVWAVRFNAEPTDVYNDPTVTNKLRNEEIGEAVTKLLSHI